MNNIGVCYLNGDGIERNYIEAISWLKQSIDKGHGGAARDFAAMYRDGLGVESDLEMATHWYERAIAMGDAGAKPYLEAMQERARQRARREQQSRQQDNSQQRSDGATGLRDGGMSRKLALEILDLTEDATREEIESAYKRMMMKNHPDSGGSTFFAKQLNAARAVLLGKK